MKFMLHEFIEGGVTRMIFKTNPNGSGVINSRVTFLPGEVYEATDEKLIKLIKGEIGDIRQKSLLTPNLKETLTSYNVPYTTIRCGTCVGSKPHALYNPFKILEDENE